MRKLAIVIGHTARSPGAVRQDTGEHEFFWNKDLGERAVRLSSEFADLKVKLFYRPEHLGFRPGLRACYAETDAWGADFTNELHFNSHHKPTATGTEVLSSGTVKSLEFADALQDELLDALGLRNRGLKIVTPRGRGGFNLICGKAPAVIQEPFFGSSDVGLRATDEDHEKDAIAIAMLRAALRVNL